MAERTHEALIAYLEREGWTEYRRVHAFASFTEPGDGVEVNELGTPARFLRKVHVPLMPEFDDYQPHLNRAIEVVFGGEQAVRGKGIRTCWATVLGRGEVDMWRKLTGLKGTVERWQRGELDDAAALRLVEVLMGDFDPSAPLSTDTEGGERG